MANTKKSLKNSKKVTELVTHPLISQLNHFLSRYLKPNQHVLLALSGGLDSTVLLHLLAAAKQTIRFELHAMHVHHGLSPNADAWADFCMQQCQLLNVPIKVVRVQLDLNAKQGIEAAARQLRYEALFDFKVSGIAPDFVVTAHHQDDQAETLLLQLFRGAGVKGLASMGCIDESRRLMRPLLDISRQTLQEYAEQNNIQWCNDESNDNTQYERNFVRHDVMPVLATRYPSVKSVLARTASHLAEANDLLDTLAKIDADKLLQNNSLCLQDLTGFDLPRAKNLLRWWFSQNQLAMPTSEHLNEIIQQLFNAKADANINIQLQHLSLKRYQQRAYLCAERLAEPFDMTWNGEPYLNLPNGGQLHFKQVVGSGLALKHGMTKLRITNRDGGERFKPDVLRPTRTLKHLLQEASIPPWQREHLPLIYWHDTLALVPNIGIAHELQATENELGLDIIWQDI
ncbi:tRNA lysidine(34) synthetase TilS [Methylotenera versatilis]|uniref:tRNA(Ile)-lysidine synthase n=1 Tax=Methylotenera versatilis (strain 301) TaxID=666681 RepID=D7DIX6_METV0|nr:tRNA lysidine(34) synthetase TilS [Methylotenera versatilis]ADI30011.1 tRNA(Ile)-lysidine synthetase [Methylotenera versatilis 301]